jgi:hypothetical protein
MENNNNFNLEMSASSIPDIDEMMITILDLLDFVESENMEKLENSFLDDFDLANSLEKTMPLDKSNKINTQRKIINLRKIAKEKKQKFESYIYTKYNNILPMKIISLYIDKNNRYENLNENYEMFKTLKAVKEGKININDASSDFGEKLRQKYVYDKLGGKECYDKMIKEAEQKEKEEKEQKNNLL